MLPMQKKNLTHCESGRPSLTPTAPEPKEPKVSPALWLLPYAVCCHNLASAVSRVLSLASAVSRVLTRMIHDLRFEPVFAIVLYPVSTEVDTTRALGRTPEPLDPESTPTPKGGIAPPRTLMSRLGGVQMSSENVEMWDRFGKIRKKTLKSTNNLKTASGGLVDFSELAGKEFDRVLTILPMEYMEDAKVQATTEMLEKVLGPLELSTIEPGSEVVIIKLKKMTKVATDLLAIGRWRPMRALDPTSDRSNQKQEILAIHKGTVVGTKDLPVKKVKGGFNSVEVRWAPNTKGRVEVYATLEGCLEEAYASRIPENLFLDDRGRGAERGAEGAMPAKEAANMFKRAETRMVHRIKAISGHVSPQGVVWSHTDTGKEVPGVAEIEQLAWKVDSCFEMTDWTREHVIQAAAEKLGIELHADYHSFNKHAANDLRSAWTRKQAVRDGTLDPRRMIIKVECIPTEKEQGVSHTTMLAGHLRNTRMVKMIGAVMDTETVSRSEASATGYSFFALIEKPSTHFARLVNNKTIDGVSINPWNIGDSLTINPVKVLLNEHGEPTLSARKRENLAARTTTEIIKEKLMINLRQKAVETALTSANVMANMVDRETENSKIEDEIEALENMKLRKSLQDRLMLARGEAAPPEAQKAERNEGQQEEAEKEITVVVHHQTNGSKHQVTIRHKDMERHTDLAFISLSDLAYYAIKFGEIPTDLGLPSEVVEEGPVDVYLEALLSIDGAETVELPTIGKHAKAAAINIGDYVYEQEATVFLRARLPTVTKADHPEWLRASAVEQQSPSPSKKAKRDAVTVPPPDCAHRDRLMRGCRRREDETCSRNSPQMRERRRPWKLTNPKRAQNKNNKRRERHRESKKANRTCRSYKTSNKADWRNNYCIHKLNYLPSATSGGRDRAGRGIEEMGKDTNRLGGRKRAEGKEGEGDGRCQIAAKLTQQRGGGVKAAGGRGKTRGANKNGEPIPGTHTDASREEAEGLGQGFEFGATKHSPTEAETNERMWRKEMRDDGGEAQNEGTLPETHTEERCERAEDLELEAEFGSTEHPPTEAEANERVWRKEVRDNAGEAQNEGILPETHTEERCGRAEALELEAGFGSTEHTPDMYEYKVWEPQGPDNDEEGKTEGRAGRGNIEPSRNRETETRGLWTRARAHETQPHEYTGAGGGERSQTLERGRALSKVSGSTRIRRNVDITRRENKKRVLRRKKTKGIHTHIRGITLSAKHNERVTGSSTGRGYVVFDEMAGHGEDAAVMLGIAPGLAIAGLYGSITDPRTTGPPLEEAALESTGHEETTSRQGGAEGKHHGTLAGVQVRAESTLPVTARLILPYQIEETPVYLEAASEGTQGEDRIGKILCCAGEHQWELNLATLRDTELEPGAVRVVKVSTRLSIETKHVSGNRLGGGEQPVAEIVGDETGKLLNRRVDTTGNRYLAAGRPLPGLWWHRYKTDLWRSRSQEAAPNRNCGSARPRKTEMAIAARTAKSNFVTWRSAG